MLALQSDLPDAATLCDTIIECRMKFALMKSTCKKIRVTQMDNRYRRELIDQLLTKIKFSNAEIYKTLSFLQSEDPETQEIVAENSRKLSFNSCEYVFIVVLAIAAVVHFLITGQSKRA